MIRELWGVFPRLMEQNINGLLDGAMPNRAKAFQLYKACQREGLWTEAYEKFSQCLEDFYSRARVHRRKGQFDSFLTRPMSLDVYSSFHLNFRSAEISDGAIQSLASWAHNLMRVNQKSVAESSVISLDVMLKTIRRITNPGPLDKAENIEFEDFCAVWKATVSKMFGQKYESELKQIVGELKLIDAQLKLEALQPQPSYGQRLPGLEFSNEEFKWVMDVKEAVNASNDLPEFPGGKSPEKTRLRDLERVVSLYKIVQTTNLPELIKHRQNVRLTVLDRCEKILAAKHRLSSY